MRLVRIEVNHMNRPIGFNLNSHLHIVGFLDKPVTDKLQRKLIVKTNDKEIITFDWEKTDNLIFDFPIKLAARTRYEVVMMIKNDQESSCATTYFETGQIGETLQGKWIGTEHKDLHSIILYKKFTTKDVKKSSSLY